MADVNCPGFDRSRISQLQRFHDLMRFRVNDILLVSSLYDSFILSEDGQVSELILNEFLDLNLHHTPGLTRVSTGQEALDRLRDQQRFNLVVTSLHVGDMDALALARKVKEQGLDISVVVLAYDNRELNEFMRKHDVSDIEQLFLWQGDARILLAIVKYVEDKRNVHRDTGAIGVQSVIVIEDNVRFYSSFLPVIYTELVKQSQNVLAEGMNLSQKVLRMRARPKILLCDTYEEAWNYFTTYRDDILGIISDIQFPRDGKLTPQAGVEFARQVREVRPDVPIMLQSSLPRNEALALAVGADFLLKGSPVLLEDLRRFMRRNFAFGDFVFRLPDGSEVGRASDLRGLEKMFRTVPVESLAYHGERNHFSNWLKARAEFALADKLRPRKVTDYPSLEELRRIVSEAIRDYRLERDRAVVADFDREHFDASIDLYRIGGGSLGGKARGLAFANFLLNSYPPAQRFTDVRVSVPPSVVLGTDVFDRFLDENELREFAIEVRDDAEIQRRFQEAPFPKDILEDLTAYLRVVRYPVAVRSSSLLEDSPYQPFAGIYETFMLPNNEASLKTRLERLVAAVKMVYASTFSEHAKAYLDATPYRLEEEKMAVIVQKIVGAVHGNRLYPDFSGVARSHNFYPTGPTRYEDGIAAVALGLGRTVVEGETCLRFCPRYPQHLVQFSSVDDVLKNSQRTFYALQLEGNGVTPEWAVHRFGLETAEEDGTLASLVSTYSHENDAVYDGLSRPGTRLVSFAPILKHAVFPLAELLCFLLELGAWGTSSNVEIEFAVNLSTPPGEPKEFGFLQMRPQAVAHEVEDLALEDVEDDRVICRSPSVLGNGRHDLKDLVVVDYRSFDRARSREAAREVAQFNAKLARDGRSYLLLGVGRWGSNDPWLGIPVTWDQIAGVRVIVESGFRDFRVTPSQGTHFFQNLTSCNVGYFTVNPEAGDGVIDWDWLDRQAAAAEGDFFRHLRFEEPVAVLMNGKRQEGVILKPENLP
jgi:CheY-like chemotaxis protein